MVNCANCNRNIKDKPHYKFLIDNIVVEHTCIGCGVDFMDSVIGEFRCSYQTGVIDE